MVLTFSTPISVCSPNMLPFKVQYMYVEQFFLVVLFIMYFSVQSGSIFD